MTTLIRKASNRFKLGEVLYLHHCDTGDLYGVLRGPHVITEIKHQSDTGVTFFLHPRADDGFWSNDIFVVEFAREQKLNRLRGELVTHFIEETP